MNFLRMSLFLILPIYFKSLSILLAVRVSFFSFFRYFLDLGKLGDGDRLFICWKFERFMEL